MSQNTGNGHDLITGLQKGSTRKGAFKLVRKGAHELRGFPRTKGIQEFWGGGGKGPIGDPSKNRSSKEPWGPGPDV